MTASPSGPGHHRAANRLSVGDAVQGAIIQAGSIDSVVLAMPPAGGQEDTAPRQLPAAPRGFLNRARELRVLDALGPSGDGSPLIVVLNGMSGVGKTAVGLHWARANAHRFPGGQLHVDLADYRHEGGVATNDVLAAFLTALGVHQHFIPARLAERAAMFRSRTAVAPVLVFVDNADQAAQVRPLVPGAAGSAVVVTSRNRLSSLAFDGAEFIDLSPLGDTESYAMLAGMLPERLRGGLRHEDTGDLLALCGGLPVALRIAAARLAERGRWSPAALAAYLSNEDRRLARLSAGGRQMDRIFDAVVAALAEPARRLYRCLGLHPGPEFGPGVAAAAAELSAEDTADALDHLFEANLIEDVAPQRYRFHDLIRLHATKSARSDDADSVRARIESWYLAGAVAADVAVAGVSRWRLWPRGASALSAAEAMGWYETERANLIATVRGAARRHRDETVLRFCEALWPFYHGRKHHADWIESHRHGVAAAARLGNGVAEARVRNQLARAYTELDRFAEAEAELRDARTAAEATHEPRAEAVVLEAEGVLRVRQGRFAEAAERFAGALRINERIGDKRGAALERYHRADALVRGGIELGEAVRLLERTLTTAEEIADETTAARASIVLGSAHLQTGDPVTARRVLERAAETMRRRSQPIKEIQALETLAAVAERTADACLAAVCSERLSALYMETGKTAPG